MKKEAWKEKTIPQDGFIYKKLTALSYRFKQANPCGNRDV